MVIGVIRIILPGIILSGELVCRQIQKQSGAAFVIIEAADDPVQKALVHKLFDYDPCTDPQAAAPYSSSMIFRQFCIGEICQKVRVRIHHLRIIFALLSDRSPFWDVVLFIRLINPVVFVVDVDHTLDHPLVDLPFNLWYFHLKIVIHLLDLSLVYKYVYLLNNYTKDSPEMQ